MEKVVEQGGLGMLGEGKLGANCSPGSVRKIGGCDQGEEEVSMVREGILFVIYIRLHPIYMYAEPCPRLCTPMRGQGRK
jgi:hypothetical protein